MKFEKEINLFLRKLIKENMTQQEEFVEPYVFIDEGMADYFANGYIDIWTVDARTKIANAYVEDSELFYDTIKEYSNIHDQATLFDALYKNSNKLQVTLWAIACEQLLYACLKKLGLSEEVIACKDFKKILRALSKLDYVYEWDNH